MRNSYLKFVERIDRASDGGKTPANVLFCYSLAETNTFPPFIECQDEIWTGKCAHTRESTNTSKAASANRNVMRNRGKINK